VRLPRLNPTAQIVLDGPRLVVLVEGGDDLELEGNADEIRGLLSALDGRTPLSEIAVAGVSTEEIAEGIGLLADAGLVDDAADDELLTAEERARYDRQLRYFGEIGSEARAVYQRRLGDASVCVLGLGGLGGMASMVLTACGVGHIVGVDGDQVEVSNLARQLMFGEADLGRSKVRVTAWRLQALRSDVEFRGVETMLDSPEAVAEVIAGADAVVAAVDWPAGKIGRWVNEACVAARIPYVAMSQHPPLVRIGPTYVPGRTGCLACQEAGYRRDHPGYDELVAQIADASPAATYAPACGVIGSLVANEVVALLSGLHEPACLGRSSLLDLRTLSITTQPVVATAGCEVCGTVS
jgi:bacteriocin biosynthesis cyclodehydratase domain-containing protein